MGSRSGGTFAIGIGALLAVPSCEGGRGPDGAGADASDGADTDASEGSTQDGATAEVGSSDGSDESGASMPSCPAPDEPVAPPTCSRRAPADAFDPVIEWAWDGEDGFVHSLVTPLVANMTDDNDDGAIDLCDRPDVIVVAYPAYGEWWDGRIFVLDGATGEVATRFDTPVWALTTPAVGDIDQDGRPEIVTADGLGPYPIAFEDDGTVKWNNDQVYVTGREAVALADLRGDGEVAAILGREVLNAALGYGSRLPRLVDPDATTTAADLDGDGRLEVTIGWAAWSLADDPHGGELGSGFELYYENEDVGLTVCPSGIAPGDPGLHGSLALGLAAATCPDNGCNNASGHPHVANLDADPQPEILLTDEDGLSVLEHDGTTKYAHLRPTGALGVDDGTSCDYTNWLRPGAVHTAAIVTAAGDLVAAYDDTLAVLGAAPIVDLAGSAGATVFDFLGDGSAEIVHADESTLRVLDLAGDVVFELARTSVTLIEYPVVADVDDDGSAEIVVVSNGGPGRDPGAPTVQVIGDARGRWVPTRRIWNQHTYHVTNVREDGTIPRAEPPHHAGVNVFRANVQVEDGVACIPEP